MINGSSSMVYTQYKLVAGLLGGTEISHARFLHSGFAVDVIENDSCLTLAD